MLRQQFVRTVLSHDLPGVSLRFLRRHVPTVNAALLVGCVLLVFLFRKEKSSGLAAAFGLAVTATMVITSLLFSLVARKQWGWSLPKIVALVGLFLIIDVGFLSANLAKVAEGGWIPLSIGAVLLVIMTTWRAGREELSRYLSQASVPLDLFLSDLTSHALYRPEGAAVFMTGAPDSAPLHMLHHLKHNKALHEKVLLLSITTERIPDVPDDKRTEVRELGAGFYQIVARYGYMQSPDVPALIAGSGILVKTDGPPSYYLGRDSLVPSKKKGMTSWRKWLFSYLNTNARPVTDYFGLPPNRVVELGAQIEL